MKIAPTMPCRLAGYFFFQEIPFGDLENTFKVNEVRSREEKEERDDVRMFMIEFFVFVFLLL